MVPVGEYPARLASMELDVAVAPLEDHPFNRAKSNLRLLEFGALGVPVVASDIHPYRNSPAIRVGPGPEEWTDAVLALARDRQAAVVAGAEMRRWVLENFTLGRMLSRWRRAVDPAPAR